MGVAGRSAALALVLSIGLLGLTVTPCLPSPRPAGADPGGPGVVPERAAGGTEVRFVDDPTILDPHPHAPEAWGRVADPDAIAVYFTSGVPECHGVHAAVTETADTVTVRLVAGTPPPARGRVCVMLAVPGFLDVPLSGPVGDRTVLSG